MYLKLHFLGCYFSYHWPFGYSLGKIPIKSDLTSGCSCRMGLNPCGKMKKTSEEDDG